MWRIEAKERNIISKIKANTSANTFKQRIEKMQNKIKQKKVITNSQV